MTDVRPVQPFFFIYKKQRRVGSIFDRMYESFRFVYYRCILHLYIKHMYMYVRTELTKSYRPLWIRS